MINRLSFDLEIKIPQAEGPINRAVVVSEISEIMRLRRQFTCTSKQDPVKSMLDALEQMVGVKDS